MKKVLIGLVAGLVAIVLGLSFIGMTPAYIASAPGVGAGIGAKLLCSSRYVSGYSEAQSFDDLVQYSPLLENLSISYDETSQTVTTSLFGLSETTASYMPGIGCTIDYAGYTERAPMAHSAVRPSAPWPAGNQVMPGVMANATQALLDEMVAEDNEAGLNTRALLIAHRGRILGESYAQETDRDTPLLGWSMAKSLTAMMLGNLEYRGILDLSDPVGFESWQGDDRSNISITHLLNMTDGLAFSEEYNPGDDATAMLFTEPAAAAFVLAKPLAHEPGTFFNYSSGTANLASQLYFDHTGATLRSSYNDFMTHLFEPMAMRRAVFEVDATGVFMGSSYFYATGRDWARIGQLMLNGGQLNGARIVTEEWVERATSPNNSENTKAYGYFWWLNRGDENLRWPDLPTDAYAAQGNRQQWVMIIPSADLVIVRLGWTAGRYPANENFARILNAIR